MPHRSETPWKTIAITLAVVLAIVLVFAALVVSGIMELGLSLM